MVQYILHTPVQYIHHTSPVHTSHQSSTYITPVQYIHHTSPVHTSHQSSTYITPVQYIQYISPVQHRHQPCTFITHVRVKCRPITIDSVWIMVGLPTQLDLGFRISNTGIPKAKKFRALNNNKLVLSGVWACNWTLPEALQVLFALMWHSTLSTIMQLPVGMEVTLWYATISCMMSF